MSATPALRPLLAAAILLLAGCAAPEAPATPADTGFAAPAAPEVQVLEGHITIHRDVGLGGCTGAGVNPHDQSYERGVLEIPLGENATAVAIRVGWTPVNPTAERLNFSLYGALGPGSQPVLWRTGTSPFAWDLADVDALPRYLQLVPSGDPCDAPGVYASAIVGQELAYRVTVA